MKLRKITALITSVFMAITTFSASAFADDTSKKTSSFESINISSATENVYESDLVMNLNSSDSKKEAEDQLRGNFNGSDWFINTDTLESNDAIDTYVLNLTGTRTAVFALETTNTDYVAIICPYDPATGDITLSGPYVTGGNTSAVNDLNSDGQNDFCVVVLNQGSTYGTSYTFAFNAKNSGGATSIVNASPDFSVMVCGYSGNIYKMNNVNIKTKVLTYINQHVPTNDPEKIYTRDLNTGNGLIMKLYVKSTISYLSTNSMEYGIYQRGSNVYYHTVKIPIFGTNYYCYRWSNVDGTNWDGGTPDGYMVYDLETDAFIDWASSLNFYHTTFYNEAFSFSSAANL